MSRPVLAHIIGGGPVWPLWITGTVLFGGAVAAMAVPTGWRRVGWAVSVIGPLSEPPACPQTAGTTP